MVRNLDGSYKSQLSAVHYLCQKSSLYRMINKGEGKLTIKSLQQLWCSQGSYLAWRDYLYIDQNKEEIRLT